MNVRVSVVEEPGPFQSQSQGLGVQNQHQKAGQI